MGRVFIHNLRTSDHCNFPVVLAEALRNDRTFQIDTWLPTKSHVNSMELHLFSYRYILTFNCPFFIILRVYEMVRILFSLNLNSHNPHSSYFLVFFRWRNMTRFEIVMPRTNHCGYEDRQKRIVHTSLLLCSGLPTNRELVVISALPLLRFYAEVIREFE